MKIIKLMLFYLNKIKTSAIVIIIITVISMLFLTYTISTYRYYDYSASLFKNAKLSNAVYLMINQNELTDNFNLTHSDVKEKLKTFKAVDYYLSIISIGSLSYEEEPVSMCLYDENTLNHFPLKTTKPFDTNLLNLQTNDSTIPVVVGSEIFESIKINTEYNLKLKNKELKIKIVGQMPYPFIYLSLSGSGTNVHTNDFLLSRQIIITKETPELLKRFENTAIMMSPPNMFVKFKDDATEIEKEKVLLYINSVGTSSSYSEIIKNTDDLVNNVLKKQMPFPIFVLLFSTLSLFSICVLMIYKKIHETSILYICGASKRKIYLLSVFSLVQFVLISSVISIIFIYLYPLLQQNKIIELQNVIIDSKNIFYILIYSIFAILISAITPLLVLKNDSPIDIIRRTK